VPGVALVFIVSMDNARHTGEHSCYATKVRSSIAMQMKDIDVLLLDEAYQVEQSQRVKPSTFEIVHLEGSRGKIPP
jgi:hypothetical protein